MKSFILVGLLAILAACGSKKEKKIFPLAQNASWIIGEWKNQSPAGDFTEKWEKLSDSTYLGESYVILKKDTVFHENVLLEQRNDSLFYNVTIKEEDPTTFHLIKATSNTLEFENKKHDFPTKIKYELIKSDSILATISGKIKGVEKTEQFPMKKAK